MKTQVHRVIVVDDNPAIHQDVRKVLIPAVIGAGLAAAEAALFGAPLEESRSGLRFELDYAFQGREALRYVERALAERQPYSVALVDMRMPPGWDGLETMRELWRADPSLQIVICSAYSDYSWDEIISNLGPRDNLLVLKKPFDDVELHQMVTALALKWHWRRIAEAEIEGLRGRCGAPVDGALASQMG